MIDGQKVMERTNSPVSDEGQPKMAILEQTRMGIFLIHPVPDSIFPTRFLPKPPEFHLGNRCGPPVVGGPQFEKHYIIHTIRHVTYLTDPDVLCSRHTYLVRNIQK
jgi:hypothetical protein